MRRDGVIAIAAAALAAVYLYAAYQLPKMRVGDPLGPKIFPIILGCGLLLGAVMLVAEMRRARAADNGHVAPAAVPWRSYLPVAGLVAWTLVYFAVFETLGFVIATSVYLLVLMSLLNRGRPITNISTALLFTVGSYVVFTKLLEVRLAPGLLDF